MNKKIVFGVILVALLPAMSLAASKQAIGTCAMQVTSNVIVGSVENVMLQWNTTNASSVSGVVWYGSGTHYFTFANHATSGSEVFSFPSKQGQLIFVMNPVWKVSIVPPCVLYYSADGRPHSEP